MEKVTEFNFSVFVHGEMVENKGEDYYSKRCFRRSGYIGVFDGCGGMGAKRYASVGEHTGAFIASRIAALLTYQWHSRNRKNGNCFKEEKVENLKENFLSGLNSVKKHIEDPNEMKLKGELAKNLPTTAAMTFYQCLDQSQIVCNYVWAGDSRGYLLDSDGLAQITSDDVDDTQDAFYNLTNDAKLENVVHAGDFALNEKIIKAQAPCILLDATDGVFGYLSTPMEFEYLLLQTLMDASTPNQWEENIHKALLPYASDDFTLMMVVIGYKSFSHVQKSLKPRMQYLYKTCIGRIQKENRVMSQEELLPYWREYEGTYMRYMNQRGADQWEKRI